MIDLFNFIKELLRNEPALIAAFLMGVIVALIFLSSMLYWFFSKRYGGAISDLKANLTDLKEAAKTARDQLKEAKSETDDLQKKHKERKKKLEEQEKQMNQLLATMASAELAAREHKQREENAKKALQDSQDKAAESQTQFKSTEASRQKEIAQWKAKYNKLYTVAQEKLKSYVDQTTTLKKQVAALNDQVKLIEKLQGQLWDVPVDKAKIVPFRPVKNNGAIIIAVTNLKGGVGKTTLTANVAVTYSMP